MQSYPRSEATYQRNLQYIPVGVVSVNRNVEPRLVFRRGAGAYIWDSDDNRYIDYHGAFAAQMLGHNEATVSAAVRHVLDSENSLFGSGTTEMEGCLAELICTNIDFIDTVQFLKYRKRGDLPGASRGAGCHRTESHHQATGRISRMAQ